MSKTKQIWLSFCTVAYLIIATVELMPDTLVKTVVKPKLEPIERCLGLDQNWNLFGPTVRDTNYYVNSTITFADGSTKVYEPPRLDLIPDLWERARRYRIVKAFLYGWERPPNSDYWPFVCAYLARSNFNPENQPVMVTLSINFGLIPPIKNWVARDNLPGYTYHAAYFIYKVRPEDLK